MLLKDKICIVVGAASLRGIGYAVAELFVEHGAIVVAVDIAMSDGVADNLRSTIASRLGRPARLDGVRCDIADPNDCAASMDHVLAQYGSIDCLVNCAAIVEAKGILEMTPESFDRVIAINLKGTFNLCQQVLKIFDAAGRGVIVNVASVAAQRGGGLVGGGHYAASKGGVISLTKTIAREFGPKGIRANVVAPSMTETGMIDGMSADRYREIIDAIPLRRAGQARDIAGACLYLVSDLSAYVTGAVIDVNGGSHIH